ncbi:MAG: UvrD-helicase domain-containing protein, partial [Clostridia bacterium]|nr:UvrD-helicase domain-containing protein [Clostridia bacterium]
MSVQFTTQQINAIEGKGDALLVSAAAGSGKTAVLVERVLRYLTEQGGDIRRLMIMTYTTAAAEEMRQKIKRKVNEALQQSGGDHLMRQSAMIDSAEIGTVHSICLGLITRYFDRLDLDPRMRLIGDA